MKASKLTSMYASIRDIPYATSSRKSGTCYDKCLLLKDGLERQGFACRFMIGRFHWSAIGVPDEILRLFTQKYEKHVFLQARRGSNQWQTLDPTLDIALAAKFRITDWDGIHSTRVMTPLTNTRVYRPFTFPERVRSKLGRMFQKQKSNEDFYEALDSWLDGLRKN